MNDLEFMDKVWNLEGRLQERAKQYHEAKLLAEKAEEMINSLPMSFRGVPHLLKIREEAAEMKTGLEEEIFELLEMKLDALEIVKGIEDPKVRRLFRRYFLFGENAERVPAIYKSCKEFFELQEEA